MQQNFFSFIFIRSILMVLNNLLSFIFSTCFDVKDGTKIFFPKNLLTIFERTIKQSSVFEIKNRSISFRCAQKNILQFYQFMSNIISLHDNFIAGYLMSSVQLFVCFMSFASAKVVAKNERHMILLLAAFIA